jgi:hypothetical protein
MVNLALDQQFGRPVPLPVQEKMENKDQGKTEQR